MLAAAIAVLHHLPLTRVFALRRRDAAVDGARVTLWPDAAEVALAAPLATGFARFASPGPLAFPGRNGLQPLSASAVRHHVGRASAPERGVRYSESTRKVVDVGGGS